MGLRSILSSVVRFLRYVFSVAGDALNFGGRRMETIARVAWLPVALLLVANMAAIFGYLSVISGRVITFEDVPTFFSAQLQFARLAASGFEKNPEAMWAITIANLTVQTLLVSSFMAPLIRYAGLGEKPAPGAVRAPFGPDQLRFIVSGLVSFLFVSVLVFGPVAAVSYYSLSYIADAMAQTLASFPDPDSLHTIELTTAGASLAEQGMSWVYEHAMPLAFVTPFALLVWLIMFLHFHPRNRPAAPERGNVILRGLTTLIISALMLFAGYQLLAGLVVSQFQASATTLGAMTNLASTFKLDLPAAREGLELLLNTPAGRLVAFGAVWLLLLNYFSLRLYPYTGVAVCRKSLALGGTLSVSRGWKILRLWAVITAIAALLYFVQAYLINVMLLQIIAPVVLERLLTLTTITTRLVNSGVTAEWVMPTFVWIWNITKIIINVLWSFFSFGVAAGLYGRLYRESEAGA